MGRVESRSPIFDHRGERLSGPTGETIGVRTVAGQKRLIFLRDYQPEVSVHIDGLYVHVGCHKLTHEAWDLLKEIVEHTDLLKDRK